MIRRIAALVSLLGCAAALLACEESPPACEAATCLTTDTGTGGEGGGGSSSSGCSGTTCSTTTSDSECQEDADCPWGHHEGCGIGRCIEGKCQEENYSPDYSCGSPDPDSTGPWPPDDAGGHCWDGACCFTCLVDNGSAPRKLDPFDGPCVAGKSDDFCGADGMLCQNCTIQGKVCVNGTCVMDP